MINNEFKTKALDAAISSIIVMCRKKKIFADVVSSMILDVGSRCCIGDDNATQLELVLAHIVNQKFWSAIKKRTMEKVESNVRKYPMPKDEYHFLLHCVNTLIQVYAERWLQKINYNIQDFGKETFELAGKKLFGLDFKCKDEKAPREETWQLNDINSIDIRRFITQFLENNSEFPSNFSDLDINFLYDQM